MQSEREFDKFYAANEYARTLKDRSVSMKSILWSVWNAAWQQAYRKGREELAAELTRSLHQHMGKKRIIAFDE